MIFNCGCSWSSGVYITEPPDKGYHKTPFDFFETHSRKIATLLKQELCEISLPGASNYCIVKQIEFALRHNPSIILFNTTTSRRFDVPLSGPIAHKPSLEDFTYGPFGKFNGGIKSLTASRILFTAQETNSKWWQALSDSIVQHYDKHILADQQRMFFESIMFKIPKFICFDFGDILDESPGVVKISWKDMVNKYPCEYDKFHFNQQGYDFLFETALKFL